MITALTSYPVTLPTVEAALCVVSNGMSRHYAQHSGDLLSAYPGDRMPWRTEDWTCLPALLHSKVPEVCRCPGCGSDIDECACTGDPWYIDDDDG